MADGVRYAIRVKGHLDDRWGAWFDQASVVNHEKGEATLHVMVRDQAALYGLLDRIRDLNLHLLSVKAED